VVSDRDADDAGAYDDHPATASQNAHDAPDLSACPPAAGH